MASLMSLAVACAFALAVLRGQGVAGLPVPVWPDGQISPTGQDGRYVYLTEDRHTVVVLIPQDPELGIKGPKKPVRVPLKNDLKPSISVSLDHSGDLLSYRYAVRNGQDARDAIGKFGLVVPARIEILEVRHEPTDYRKPWGGTATHIAIASQPLFPWVSPGRYVYWYRSDHNVIPPGEMVGGFKLTSSSLPGFTTTCVGSGELVEFDQSWPMEVFRQLELLEDRQFREVCMPSIGPVFPVGTSRRVIAEEFRQDLEAMGKTGWINPSSPYVVEAMRLLARLREADEKTEALAFQIPARTQMEELIDLILRFSLGVSHNSVRPF